MTASDSSHSVPSSKPIHILGIQLSCDPISIAWITNGKMVFEWAVRSQRESVDSILIDLQTFLTQSHLLLSDISALGVVNGPGSYTGSRIAVVLANTLSQFLNVPVYSVNALYALVHPFRYSKGLYVSLLPAVRGDISCAWYAMNRSSISTLLPPFVWTPDKLKAKMLTMQGALTLVGQIPDFLLHSEIVNPQFQLVQARVSAVEVALYAASQLAVGKPGEFRTVKPFYAYAEPPVLNPKRHLPQEHKKKKKRKENDLE